MEYRKLCDASDLKQQMVEYLRQQFEGMGDDLTFDIEAAIYWFAADYHGGQWSELYSILSTSQYEPGMAEYSPASEGHEAHWEGTMVPEMYQALESRFGGNSPEPAGMSDVEADADAYRSIGWGTDEDYGSYGGGEE